MSYAFSGMPDRVSHLAIVLILGAGLSCAMHANADETPPPSKHQLMKECMAKQKASEAGRPKEEMKKICEDVAKTEKQNANRAQNPKS
jgi:hypothetical protein